VANVKIYDEAVANKEFVGGDHDALGRPTHFNGRITSRRPTHWHSGWQRHCRKLNLKSYPASSFASAAYVTMRTIKLLYRTHYFKLLGALRTNVCWQCTFDGTPQGTDDASVRSECRLIVTAIKVPAQFEKCIRLSVPLCMVCATQGGIDDVRERTQELHQHTTTLRRPCITRLQYM
jgi:hypothetical protein